MNDNPKITFTVELDTLIKALSALEDKAEYWEKMGLPDRAKECKETYQTLWEASLKSSQRRPKSLSL